MLSLNQCLAALLIIGVAVCTATAGQDSQTSSKSWDGRKKARSTEAVMDFAAIKQKRSESIALQIEQLNIFKACVDEAVDQAAMGACQKENRAAQKAMTKPNKGQIDADAIRKRIRDKNQ